MPTLDSDLTRVHFAWMCLLLQEVGSLITRDPLNRFKDTIMFQLWHTQFMGQSRQEMNPHRPPTSGHEDTNKGKTLTTKKTDGRGREEGNKGNSKTTCLCLLM